MPHATLRSRQVEPRVRPLDSGDRERLLDVYEATWGTRKEEAWFDWRFEANPYAEELHGVVAAVDGEVVGAEPMLPFRLRAGDRVLDALQPVDWMVHPDHRREGHASRMTERLLERYAGEARLLFNFPNGQLLPCLESAGWEVVGEVPVRYRIHQPRALAGGSSRAVTLGARLSGPALRAWTGVLDRLAAPADDVVVERHDAVPTAVVAELYRSTRPDRVHVPRDRAYLEWRFDNPRWDVTTYVAYREGSAVASVVAASEATSDGTLTRLLDVQPMADPESERSAAFAALLDAVVADAEDATLLCAPEHCYPEELRCRGFLRSDRRPLSWGASSTRLAVRPLATGEERSVSASGVATDGGDSSALTVEGRDLTDPEEWLLLPADQDVG